MALKRSQQPLQLKRYRNDDVNSTVFHEAELVADFRGAVPNLRLGDGETPGGIIIAVGEITGSVRKPSISAPLDGATGITTSPIITGSRYSAVGLEGETDPHVASRWVFSTDAAQQNILHDTGRSTEYLTEFDFQDAGVTLTNATTVYASVTYESEGGLENTSAVISFTTL